MLCQLKHWQVARELAGSYLSNKRGVRLDDVREKRSSDCERNLDLGGEDELRCVNLTVMKGLQSLEMLRTYHCAIQKAFVLFILCISGFAVSQTPDLNSEPETIPLWNHAAPGALGTSPEDTPSITIYRPLGQVSGAVHTAVIVAPGGSYGRLAANHEGRQVANWFNAMGITAFVLKYRLGPRYHHPIELQDAQRAIRLVRSRAQQYGIAPDRIGVMGFSAGGHLGSAAGTHFDSGDPSTADPVDRASSRPDFLILAYPVIFLEGPYAHQGSARNLLGEDPDPKLRHELSTDSQVTSKTPPTFLFTTSEDKSVPAENSLAFYEALRKAGVPAELHVFEKGPHGVGLDLADPSLSEWPALVINWLRQRGLFSVKP